MSTVAVLPQLLLKRFALHGGYGRLGLALAA